MKISILFHSAETTLQKCNLYDDVGLLRKPVVAVLMHWSLLPSLVGSLLWSEDVGTEARVWNMQPSSSRRDGANQVAEAFQGRTSSVR